MTRAEAAADALADWTIRLWGDLILIKAMWLFLRKNRDPSPIMRMKLALGEALLVTLKTEDAQKVRAAASTA